MTQSTVKEVQMALCVLRKFAEQDDYNLCRPYMKGLVLECTNVLETVLLARDWEPVVDRQA